jgi:hypothetical protein
MSFFGSKIYGNFKTPIQPKRKEKTSREKRPGMSEQHLACVRKLPCCITGKMPGGECHHLKGTGERGMGLRSTDKWAIPLSHDVHMDLEAQGSRKESSWFAARGIENPYALAAALWQATGDIPKMTKIVIAQRCSPRSEGTN